MSHREALLGASNVEDNNNNNNNNKSEQPVCTFKWVLRGEFIQLESNPNLVICLPDTEVRNSGEIILNCFLFHFLYFKDCRYIS